MWLGPVFGLWVCSGGFEWVCSSVFFFEWVCSGGFQIGCVSNRRRGFLTGGFVGLMAWVSDLRGFVFLIGVVVVEGGRLIRRGFDGMCLWFLLEVEGAREKIKTVGKPRKWNHA